MQNSQTLKSAGRLLEIFQLIKKYPKLYTAKKLADYFHASVRTIRRDIRLLEDMDIRVESETSGGYFIMQDHRNLPVTLSEIDKLTLELVPSLLRGTVVDGRIEPFVAAYQQAIGKILHVPVRNQKSVETASEEDPPNIVVDLKNAQTAGDDRIVMDILFAIQNNRCIEISHKKVGCPEPEIRRLNPYYLIPWQNSIYLIAYCHLRNAFRTFKVGRMQSVRCLSEIFKRDASFSLTEFMKSAWGIDQSGPEQNVTLVFDAPVTGYAKEDMQFHRVTNERIEVDGRYVVYLTVRINHEFIRFVLQYGAAVEVVEPIDLRRQVRTEIERLLSRYGEPQTIR